MLYHISRTQGLSIIEPRVSTHGKAYVYAVENMVTGLLFGAKQDDFDFIISTDDADRPIICECYPGVLEAVYRGQVCSVYSLDDTGFLRGMTSWSAELVCKQAVAVCEEIRVPDLYERLLEEVERGNLIVHHYEDTPTYKQKISKHIADRLIRFGVDLEAPPQRIAEHYGDLIAALRGITDGHLL